MKLSCSHTQSRFSARFRESWQRGREPWQPIVRAQEIRILIRAQALITQAEISDVAIDERACLLRSLVGSIKAPHRDVRQVDGRVRNELIVAMAQFATRRLLAERLDRARLTRQGRPPIPERGQTATDKPSGGLGVSRTLTSDPLRHEPKRTAP